MGIAFEKACRALGLADRVDPATHTVARRVIELAKTGERDPAKIEAAVLATFNGSG